MAAQLTPFLTLAQQYAPLLVGWQGDLVVHTTHGKKNYPVSASDTLDLTEVGVLISWRGDAPTGVFIPYGEITSIEQVPPGGGDPE